MLDESCINCGCVEEGQEGYNADEYCKLNEECQDCGWPMCEECASEYGLPGLCHRCEQARMDDEIYEDGD